tara:strand:- start:730 stop:906 length:177 start_codon:yes stop_codon:yes gene_type:complete
MAGRRVLLQKPHLRSQTFGRADDTSRYKRLRFGTPYALGAHTIGAIDQSDLEAPVGQH